MIELLAEEEQECVNVENLTELEHNVLVTLGFDFDYPSPTVIMERYLHLLNYDSIRLVNELASNIMKFALTDIHFLNYR